MDNGRKAAHNFLLTLLCMVRHKKAAGFTLVEILLIIAIIIILMTVVLVSLSSAKQKSQDASALSSVQSAAAPAFACLTSGFAGVQVNPYSVNADICSNPNGTAGSVWPDISKTGWTTFFFCDPNYSNTTPPGNCGTYQDGSCGGTRGVGAGNFCFAMKNQDGSKFIWCTLNGCRKSGF